MLINLHLENFLIIEKSTVDFARGLNVITGETGSGKSMLFDAMGLIVGDKGNKESIRSGCDSAFLQATFDVESQEAKQLLIEASFDPDEYITISREILSSGKSLFRINNRVVSGLLVKALAPYLLNISGQHENQILLDSNHHRRIIDEFGFEWIETPLSEVKTLYEAIKSCDAELESFQMDPSELVKQMEFLKYQMDEIAQAKLKHHEDEHLEERFEYLRHFENIQTAVQSVLSYCREDKSIMSQLSRSTKALQEVIGYDEAIKAPFQQLETAYFAVESAVEDLRSISDGLDYDESELVEIEGRLNEINQLKRKYGKTLTLIKEYQAQAEAKYEKLQAYDQEKSKVEQRRASLVESYQSAAAKLTDIRKQVASKFETRMIAELLSLNFQQCLFEVRFESVDALTPYGLDRLEIYLSTNPGEPLKPLRKTASGGELSRIMLAVKLVNSKGEYAFTQVFDEIDAGISGRTASAVGDKLKEISNDNQVILVTHLPQIAILGDQHLLIEKEASDRSTQVKVLPLSFEERTREIARMIGSGEITETTLANAKEMILRASKENTYV